MTDAPAELFELVRTSGFSPIHLELHIDLAPAPVSSWQVFLDSSPHPLAPTLGRIAYLSATKLSGERSASAFTESLRQFL